MTTENKGHLQFSLTALLTLTAVAAIIVASISQLPPSTGAPLLAFVATAVAAVVITAAMTSRGLVRTFYVGAAVPLLILLLRTVLVFSALVQELPLGRLAEYEPDSVEETYLDSYVVDGSWPRQRISYRWEAACALASAPLIGLLCAALQWLRERNERRAEMSAGASSRWVPIVLLTVLVLAAMAIGIGYKMTHVQHGVPADTEWDAHDGTFVPRSGTPVDALTVLSAGDKVLVFQGASWWRGRVLEVFDDGEVKIRYVGWSSSWDETVPRSRLRLP